MPNDQEVRDKLKEMAKASMFTGRISSVHQKNLTHFPFVFFNNIETLNLKYDLESQKEKKDNSNPGGIVSYYLGLEESANQDNLDKRLKSLEIAVRELFWADVKVEIYFNDRKVYESK